MLFTKTLTQLDSVEKVIKKGFKDIFDTLEKISEIQKLENPNVLKNTVKNSFKQEMKQKNRNKRRRK